MAGLFDGIVNENPEFVDSSEKYAIRAEKARDEAVSSERATAEFAASAETQVAIAKAHADRAERVKESVDGVAASVDKVKEEVVVIHEKIKTEGIIIKQFVDESNVLSDKFDADKVEIAGMKADVSADVAKAKEYRDQSERHSLVSKDFSKVSESHSLTSKNHSDTSKGFRDQAEAHKNDSWNYSVASKDYMVGAGVHEANTAILKQDTLAIKAETLVIKDEAVAAADRAEDTEMRVFGAIEIVESQISEVNGLIVEVETTQDHIEAFQGEVLVARDEAVTAKGGAFISEQMAKASEDKAKGYETGSEEYYNLVRDLYTDMKEGIVYRGTWNPKTGAYPNALDTNSAWDVITGQSEGVSFDGEMWYAGDKVIYAKEDKKYYHLASASAVQSVNGKTGAVVLTPSDIGALTTNEVYTKTEVDNKGNLTCTDMRYSESRPVDYPGNKATTWFTDKNNPTGGWYSGMTFKGWMDGYNVWQILSESGPAADTSGNKFYFRSGNLDKWNDYAEVYTSLNKPSADDLGVLSTEGGTMKGIIHANRIGAQFAGGWGYEGDADALHSNNASEWGITHFYQGMRNAFPMINGANSILTYNTHAGPYGHQMGMSGNGKMYHRSRDPEGWSGWGEFYTSTNKPTADALGMYTKEEVDGKISSVDTRRDLSVNSVKVAKGGDSGVIFREDTEAGMSWKAFQPTNGDNLEFARSNRGGAWTSMVKVDVNGTMYVNGNKKVYHEGMKPTAADVGALAVTGGAVTGRIAADGFDVVGNAGVRYSSGEGGSNVSWATGSEPSNGTWILNRYKDNYWQNSPIKVEGSTGDICMYGGVYVNDQKVYHRGDKPTAHDVGAAEYNHEHNNIIPIDNRTITPADIAPRQVAPFFTSNSHLGLGNGYSDLLVMNTYGDASGGKINALAFSKETKDLYHFQTNMGRSWWETPSKIYTSTSKPTAAEIGAISSAGGTMTSALFWHNNQKYINTSGENMYVAAKSGRLYLEGASSPLIRVAGADYNMYHEGNKPTAADVGAVSETTIVTTDSTITFMV